MRLLVAGEEVIDVPPKLSARARVFATGQGRKTDATDAHSVALVGTRMSGLRPVVNDEQLAVLRIWSTDVAPWVRTTPGWSPSCTSCCWS
jgi:transposase